MYMGPPPGMRWPVPIRHQASLVGRPLRTTDKKNLLCTWGPLLGCTGLCLSEIKLPWLGAPSEQQTRKKYYVHGAPSWDALACAYQRSSFLGWAPPIRTTD